MECRKESKREPSNRTRCAHRSELDDAAIADIRLALAQGQPPGSERFSEMLCAALGVRRAQRKPGRPKVKRDQSDRVEDQSDFGF